MSTVLITGGTGLIGTYLIPFLKDKGMDCIVLTRSVPQDKIPGVTYATWDLTTNSIEEEVMEKVDFIIHLAGANVAEKRWTKKRKKEIAESRTNSTNLLINTLKQSPNKVKAFISASGIGYYGTDTIISKKTGFKEDDPSSDDFLGETCQQWEDAVLNAANLLNIRTIIFRQGIVLTKKGGALEKFKEPLQYGIAAILGNGKQTISWIHIHDLCRMYLQAIEQPLSGVFNAVAPQLISNEEFVLSLSKKIRKKAFIPIHVPSFMLKLILGGMSIEVLKSATVSCEKIKSTGFKFIYPSPEAAFSDLLKA